MDPCDVDGTDNGQANVTVCLAVDRSTINLPFSTSTILAFRRFETPSSGGVAGLLVGCSWPADGDEGDIWYRGATTWARLAAPGTDGLYRLECDVDGGDPTLQWTEDQIADGGVERSVLHRIQIANGAAAGSYTFDTRDWRGRLLHCSLQADWTEGPSGVAWAAALRPPSAGSWAGATTMRTYP